MEDVVLQQVLAENTNIGTCIHQETCTSGTVGDIKEATGVSEWASGTCRR